MFCVKCGNKIDDGARFCPVCGNVMQAQNPTTQPQQMRTIENGEGVSFVPPRQQPYSMQQPVQPQQQPAQQYPDANNFQQQYQRPMKKKAPKKHNGIKLPKKKGVLIAIAAVLVVAITLAIFNFSVITNFFKKSFTTKEAYLKDVNIKATDEIAESIGSFIAKTEGGSIEPVSAKGSIGVELGEKGISVLENYAGTSLSWLKKLDVEYELHNDDNSKIGADLSIKMNSKKIISAEIIVDIEKQEVFIKIPELSNDYIKSALPPLNDLIGIGGVPGIDQYGYVQPGVGIIGGQDIISGSAVSGILEMIPDSETAERLIKRYLEVVFESFDNVDREGDTIEVDGVSQKADKYTIKITGLK